MRILLSFIISMFIIGVNDTVAQSQNEDNTVVIEIMEADKIPFDFSMQYEERRNIIKIRSAKPIKSLRTVDTATNSHKGYNVMGSDLIILPQRDFIPGSYLAELKFQSEETVVRAMIHVVETPVVDGGK